VVAQGYVHQPPRVSSRAGWISRPGCVAFRGADCRGSRGDRNATAWGKGISGYPCLATRDAAAEHRRCAGWASVLGEYFDNPGRDEVHVYGSDDGGANWRIVYSFEKGAIRHVHNIVYDRWVDCFWVLTGDVGGECRVLRASLDWRHIEPVISGNQQARAVAAVPKKDGLYFASDTPLEQNYIYKLDQRGNLARLDEIHASVLCGCAVGDAVFFTTMIEPSAVNLNRAVSVYGSARGAEWARYQSWKKDWLPPKLFQYGNAFLPGGSNSTNLLAVTTIAVEGRDMEASLWSVQEF